jgi:HEAT repeat protein
MRHYFLIGLVVLTSGCGQKPPAMVHGKPVAHWVEALQNPDARSRQKAVAALGNAGVADPQVVPALIGAVKDRDPRVRGAAVLALLKIGPAAQEAIPVLQEARKDKDGQVRAYAAKALEKIQGG